MTFYSYSKVVKLAFENDENHRKSGYLDSRIYITSMTANSRRPYVFSKRKVFLDSAYNIPLGTLLQTWFQTDLNIDNKIIASSHTCQLAIRN